MNWFHDSMISNGSTVWRVSVTALLLANVGCRSETRLQRAIIATREFAAVQAGIEDNDRFTAVPAKAIVAALDSITADTLARAPVPVHASVFSVGDQWDTMVLLVDWLEAGSRCDAIEIKHDDSEESLLIAIPEEFVAENKTNASRYVWMRSIWYWTRVDMPVPLKERNVRLRLLRNGKGCSEYFRVTYE